MTIVGAIVAILLLAYGILCPNIEDNTKTALFITSIVIIVLTIIGALVG